MTEFEASTSAAPSGAPEQGDYPGKLLVPPGLDGDLVRYDLAMHDLYAGRAYGCSGPGYDDIVWLESGPKPGEDKLREHWFKIRSRQLRGQVSNARALSYPALEQLTVALWEHLVEGRSDAIEQLQLQRLAVKQQFPYPADSPGSGDAEPSPGPAGLEA